MANPIRFLTVSLLALAPSFAFACDNAERIRLSDQIESLVERNAWSGVERKYLELVETKCELSAADHTAGALAAQYLGKTYEQYTRLEQANALVPDETAQQNMRGIEMNYGRVEIRGNARKRAALTRAAMPFPPDQVRSIQRAQEVMEGTGSFKGMLPAGEYQVAEQVFTVEPGNQEWLTLVVGKVKGGGGGGGGLTDQGFINWMGPVAMVGGGLWGSRAPTNPIKHPSDTPIIEVGPAGCQGIVDQGPQGDPVCYGTTRQPADIPSSPVLGVTLGWEVGFTYSQPELGVVALAHYQRTPGRNMNQMTLMLGAVVRPSIFRITAGPTWGVVFGSGTTYAPWVQQGQVNVDINDPNRGLGYSGYGMGGGLAGSFGAALFDAGPFEGVIELNGNWMRDDARGYSGIGVRLGIVPRLDRFED